MIETAETVVSSYLDSDERLLWTGQPPRGLRLRAQDAFLIPFSLLWGGFAIFWEVSVLLIGVAAPGPIRFIFPLFGLPFVIIGLYLIVGRFFADARMRARTFYGVTNERIIIVSGFFARQVKSLQLRTLTDVSFTQKNDGSGSISFGPTHFMSGFFPAGTWPGAARYSPSSFELPERAKEVHDIIRGAQRAI